MTRADGLGRRIRMPSRPSEYFLVDDGCIVRAAYHQIPEYTDDAQHQEHDGAERQTDRCKNMHKGPACCDSFRPEYFEMDAAARGVGKTLILA